MERNENQLKNTLSKIRTSANTQFKKQALDKTIEGLNESREKYTTSKRSTIHKSRYIKASIGLISAAVIGSLLVLSNNELTNLFQFSQENSGTQLISSKIPIDDLPTYIDVEHNDNASKFELYSEEGVPFITYIPEAFETMNLFSEEDNAQILSFHTESSDINGVMSGQIRFFYDKEPALFLNDYAEEHEDNSENLSYLVDEENSWFVKSYFKKDRYDVYEETIIGQQDQHTFLLTGLYVQEGEEEWEMIRDTILKEWRWKNEDTMLIK